MILTDREIRIAIKEGLIGIDPPPTEDSFASTSVDLTLAKSIRVFKVPLSERPCVRVMSVLVQVSSMKTRVSRTVSRKFWISSK